MHIISKHKDYYDGAVGMGIDKTIKYVRNNKEFEKTPEDVLDVIGELMYEHSFSKVKKINTETFYCKKKNHSVTSFFVGFCGKLYVGWKLIKKEEPKRFGELTDSKIIDIIYDVDKVRELINFKEDYKYNRWRRGKKVNKKVEFENYIIKLNSINPFEIFSNYETPSFIAGYGDFRINTILKDVDFAKVIDPYTAFQEIQMFISGVLGTNEDGHDTPMSEKEKVQQHGLDPKYSFRTRPKG